jgi:hypothetical protein
MLGPIGDGTLTEVTQVARRQEVRRGEDLVPVRSLEVNGIARTEAAEPRDAGANRLAAFPCSFASTAEVIELHTEVDNGL